MKQGLVMQLAVLGLVAVLAGSAQAADNEKGLKPGQPAPEFSLTDYNGTTHTLSGFEGKPVVLVFTTQECPWVRGADSDISAVAEKYADDGVVVVGIDSHRAVTLEQIKEYATEEELAYPIVKDEDNVYADLVGATRTPEIFVLDAEHNVVYHGAFDDRKAPDETGKTNYLDQALASVVAGEEVGTKEVAAWGCGIQRVAKQKAAAAESDSSAALKPSAEAKGCCPMSGEKVATAASATKADGDGCCATKKEGNAKKACPITGATMDDSGTVS